MIDVDNLRQIYEKNRVFYVPLRVFYNNISI